MKNDLIALMGRPAAAAEISAVLSRIGITEPIRAVPSCGDELSVQSRADGIGLSFSRARDFDLPETGTPPKDTLVLSSIVLLAEAQQADCRCRAVLPLGLRLEMSRDQVRALFGEPLHADLAPTIDRWHRDGYRIIIVYDAEERISCVTIDLPW